MVIPRLAAVAFVATALAACGTASQSDQPAPAATTSKPISRLLDVAGLTTGEEPKVAWSRDTFLNGDDAQDVLPPNLNQFAETKQLLVMLDVDGNVFAYSPDGPKGTTPIGTATGRLAVNAERNLVAWIAPGGAPTVLQEGHAKPVELQKRDGVTAGDAVAVFGRDCFNGPETVEGAGCSVYFRSSRDEPESFVSSNHGFVQPLEGVKGTFSLQDADNSGSVGWTKVTDDLTTCSTYRPSNDENGPTGRSWKTCASMPLLFSPNGKHLLATGPHGYEGLGASGLSILTRSTGKARLEVESTEKSPAAIIDMVWEDDTHVLAIVNQKLDWAIVRVGLEGSMELAGKPVHTAPESEEYPFRLAVQP